MTRTIIFTALSVVLALIIQRYGGEPTLLKEFLYYLVGAFVAVMVFDVGESENNNKKL